MKEFDKDYLKDIAENERHFATIQAGVRGLASTWALATIAGIAVLLQKSSSTIWLFPPFALIILICLLANIGLSVLWVIDQLVYQRLYNANFIAGLRIEQKFSFIPPVRAIQVLTTRGKSIASRIKFFYVAPIFGFIITALAAAVIFIYNQNSIHSLLSSSAVVLLALLTIAPLVWVVRRSREASFFILVEWLPHDLSSILKEDNCRSIIERHIRWLSMNESNE
jgi:hypothetical protein